MQAELIEQRLEAPGVYSFFFKPLGDLAWEAGDYTEISLPGINDGRRWFSIASAPHERHLRITTKLPPRPSEYKRALSKLESGARVIISPPMGSFNLPRRADKLLFLAGGLGITPYRAMLSHLIHTKNTGHDIVLVYLSSTDQYLFDDILNAINLRLIKHRTVGAPFDLDDLAALVPDWQDRLSFFAGPQTLAEGLYETAIKRGQPRFRLKLDYFTGYEDR